HLANYPSACTEQIVSQAFPAVLRGSRPQFGYVRTAEGAGIGGLPNELRAPQAGCGGDQRWPGRGRVVERRSGHAPHVLTEAGDRGHAIPADLLESGTRYLRALAQRDGNNLTEERQSAYAIYLLTRQGQRMAAEVNAALKRLESRYKGQWEQDVTAAWLAGAMQLMREQQQAERLIARMRFDAQQSNELYNDPMTRDALLMFVIARHFPQRLAEVPSDALSKLAERVNAGTYHSLSAGTT